MAHEILIGALSMIVATLPAAAAAQPDPPIIPTVTGIAPAGTPETRYCMHVDPITGSLVQTVQCWTRDEWAEQGVDVDKEWVKNGVAVEPPVRA
jgi:hypothetical protein